MGSVAEILDARSLYGIPSDLIVAMFDGMGGLVVLDSSKVNQEGEYPVLVWNPGVVDRESMGRLGDDFGSFVFALCQRAVTRWRESD
ncbi:hypothetical protein GCM10023257_11700 [Streptomyces hyderabadensis]|uniref:Knr4/Smi1-like domain-containing protein n=1 Tax=Streptomyces hyderabadensis TaxID=598549 RepID=A0ABP9HQW1_9ACTN